MDRHGVCHPREQWETGKKWRKLVVKSSVVPQHPSRLRDRWDENTSQSIHKKSTCMLIFNAHWRYFFSQVAEHLGKGNKPFLSWMQIPKYQGRVSGFICHTESSVPLLQAVCDIQWSQNLIYSVTNWVISKQKGLRFNLEQLIWNQSIAKEMSEHYHPSTHTPTHTLKHTNQQPKQQQWQKSNKKTTTKNKIHKTTRKKSNKTACQCAGKKHQKHAKD